MLTERQNPITNRKLKCVEPDGFRSPHVLRTETTTDARTLRKLFRRQSAADFVGIIKPGVHCFGLSKGQFSLVDVIREVSSQTGPCHLALSTWTVARADLSELMELCSGDRFQSVRLLLDFSFQRRQPALIAHIRRTFGDSAVVVTRNHCKFVLFGNDQFKLTCRTSMNLNFNPRLEDVELKDDAELYLFLDNILKELFSKHEPATQPVLASTDITKQFLAV